VDVVAYIDPGTGSLIIQAVVATLVAVPFFLRHQIGRLLRAIRSQERKPSPLNAEDRTT
jgi:ABC-type branched-subunit amino acid transport system permease subunit